MIAFTSLDMRSVESTSSVASSCAEIVEATHHSAFSDACVPSPVMATTRRTQSSSSPADASGSEKR